MFQCSKHSLMSAAYSPQDQFNLHYILVNELVLFWELPRLKMWSAVNYSPPLRRVQADHIVKQRCPTLKWTFKSFSLIWCFLKPSNCEKLFPYKERTFPLNGTSRCLILHAICQKRFLQHTNHSDSSVEFHVYL